MDERRNGRPVFFFQHFVIVVGDVIIIIVCVYLVVLSAEERRGKLYHPVQSIKWSIANPTEICKETAFSGIQ